MLQNYLGRLMRETRKCGVNNNIIRGRKERSDEVIDHSILISQSIMRREGKVTYTNLN
jgi:hypothetical protein